MGSNGSNKADEGDCIIANGNVLVTKLVELGRWELMWASVSLGLMWAWGMEAKTQSVRDTRSFRQAAANEHLATSEHT